MNILCPNRIPCCEFTTLQARPFITNDDPPDACAGADYFFLFEATGGTPPYTWAVVLGNLPDGLMLSEDGMLFGVPTLDGTFIFTVALTDFAGVVRAKQYFLTLIMCEFVRAVMEEGGVPGAILDEGGGAWLEE